MRHLRFLCLMMGGYFSVLSQAWALPSQSLESIEYLTHQGAAEVEIGFAQPVYYLSHFPFESRGSLPVFLGPSSWVHSAGDKLS